MHDKKSQHVGNHGGAYTDMDGMRRQFTHIDYDVKTKIASPVEKPSMTMGEVRNNLIESILGLPPSMAPDIFSDFREVKDQRFVWNETMLRDEGIPFDRLVALKTLVSNRMDLHNII